MSTKKQSLIIFFITVSIVSLATAKGLFSTVKITNAETGELIEVGSSDDEVSQFFLFDRCTPVNPNTLQLKNSYEIQRGVNAFGIFEPFDMLIYYPDAESKRGYIHYIGLVNADGVQDGASEYDNRWYLANPQAEPYLRQLLFDEPVIESPFSRSLWSILRSAC